MINKLLAAIVFQCFTLYGYSQYWQQHVDYVIKIDFDVQKSQFKGSQSLTYTNNSPDVINHVYYHLYFNAFQPGSAMDVRSRSLPDPDPRISDRISRLQPDEIGYHHILSLNQDGKKLRYKVEGTILEVPLDSPIKPGGSTTLEMTFESQVPKQIRRSGRENDEGVDFTLTQWYPKLAAYDNDGWHTDPYIGREFYGDFGDFDVTITIDSSYTIGGTGVLQNPDQIGHGYSNAKPGLKKLSWHFKAERVHDFAWAADPEFLHTTAKVKNGPDLHFFFRNDSLLLQNWTNLIPKTVQLFEIMNARFGKYPYPQFSVIQAGDGGMEYPMCTMITGGGKFGGLVSVTVHEAIHNWFYGVLATNELKYPWMDEGFTTYAQNLVLDSLFNRKSPNPQLRSYYDYISFIKSGKEEPLTTHADHFETSEGYGTAAYSKGCLLLTQLRYIMGAATFDAGMLAYFNKWQLKHPSADDFKRVMEHQCGFDLDWFFEDWLGTTKQIDYTLRMVEGKGKETKVIIESLGEMLMPLDIYVTYESGITVYYIPLDLMRGQKKVNADWIVVNDWEWGYQFYELTINQSLDNILSIDIDPTFSLADRDPSNNRYPFTDEHSILKSK